MAATTTERTAETEVVAESRKMRRRRHRVDMQVTAKTDGRRMAGLCSTRKTLSYRNPRPSGPDWMEKGLENKLLNTCVTL